ncbi:hypothetical protein [Hymenobacter nivis]|uniref:Uncharacterized protein n=1 Tax=Hymenobacter nivis TaxID=1850093 RepID=A0A502GV39_9BACT|nr:hypothetical protein [Hymenobacter nivis]TPG66099.1 hypothetical protein EAH73_12070 [Hymenobacter nivis]
MRLSLICLFTTLTALDQSAQQPQGLQRLDDKYGFQEARFGAPLSAFTKLYLHSDQGNVKLYWRKPAELKVGGYKLYEPTYSFYKGKLMGIICSTGDEYNTDGIRKMLVSSYGSPKVTTISQDWQGKKVYMWLATLPKGRLFTISSIPITNQKAADAAIEGHKAATDR